MTIVFSILLPLLLLTLAVLITKVLDTWLHGVNYLEDGDEPLHVQQERTAGRQDSPGLPLNADGD